MPVEIVSFSSIGRRGSMLPGDFIYRSGERVKLIDGGEYAVVVRQHHQEVYVSFVERVPGSGTEFSCSVPVPVSVFDIALRKTKR